MKEKFECPIADADTQPYTTEECGVCCAFWDCETGLKKCLNDDDYSDHHEDIKKALNNIQQ